MNKKTLLALSVIMIANISLYARGHHGGYHHGGYHHGGHGYHGGYHHGGYWNSAGLGLTTGLVTGAMIGSAANNNNNYDPVAQAQADQMRYDLQQQRENDRKQRNYDNDSSDYESNKIRSRKIQELKLEIAQLEKITH